MKNKDELYDILRSSGFKLIEQDTSKYFGDYYDTFANDAFELRFSSSKSFEEVDIRSREEKENWYDLALVKALLYNEEKLSIATAIEEHNKFLKKELHRIGILFSKKNYSATKKKLDELGNERAKQMFP